MCVGDGQTGPPGEVLNLRRAVNPELAARQLRKRFVTGKRSRCRDAFIEQRVGELLAAAGAAADDGIEFRQDSVSTARQPGRLRDDMGKPLHAVRQDASSVEDWLQLLTGELLTAAQRLDHCLLASAEDRCVELESTVMGCHRLADTGPVSASIQRISAGATKCQVGRMTCVRRILPAANARSMV